MTNPGWEILGECGLWGRSSARICHNYCSASTGQATLPLLCCYFAAAEDLQDLLLIIPSALTQSPSRDNPSVCCISSLHWLPSQSPPLVCSFLPSSHPTRSAPELCLSSSCLLNCSLPQAGLDDVTGFTWLPSSTNLLSLQLYHACSGCILTRVLNLSVMHGLFQPRRALLQVWGTSHCWTDLHSCYFFQGTRSLGIICNSRSSSGPTKSLATIVYIFVGTCRAAQTLNVNHPVSKHSYSSIQYCVLGWKLFAASDGGVCSYCLLDHSV